MTILLLILLFQLYVVVTIQEDNIHNNMNDQKLKYHQFNHYHQFNITVLSELEHLGELYNDEDQKYIERHAKISDDFQRLKPNFPCVTGVTPLGSADKISIDDGHKFACGLHAVAGHPIIYSFGSHQQQDFELAILRLRPDAQIFTFELMPSMLPPIEVRDSRISYNAVGLGGYENIPNPENYIFKTMKQMMIENNHTYIDIVKMDIEGYEYMWLKYEASTTIPRIGQLLVEVHVHFGFVQEHFPSQDAVTFVETCENFGFRLFHQELNKHHSIRFTELSLIHHNWTKWNLHKFDFEPL